MSKFVVCPFCNERHRIMCDSLATNPPMFRFYIEGECGLFVSNPSWKSESDVYGWWNENALKTCHGCEYKNHEGHGMCTFCKRSCSDNYKKKAVMSVD